MKLLTFWAVIIYGFVLEASATREQKVVCYYDSQAYRRTDELAKVEAENLKPALESCDYLIYGYAGINKDTYEVESLDKDLDLDTGKNYFKTVTGLKVQFPHLKVLLSIGGFRDYESPDKYLNLLKNEKYMKSFTSSVKGNVQQYGFDGVDLAWQFPLNSEKRDHSITGIIWEAVKKYIPFLSVAEKNPEISRKGFSSLCATLRQIFTQEKITIFLTILPHIKYKEYIDTDAIKPYVDYVHLAAFDYRTPIRSMNEADYSAPLYYKAPRDPEQNVLATVGWWISNFPRSKLILGMSTFGRSWKLNYLTGKSHVPPIKADGPGPAGKHLAVEGMMAYYEICLLVQNSSDQSSDKLSCIYDSSNYLQGKYGYRLADSLFSKGIWVSHEDLETIMDKATFAKNKFFGGIALVDLSLDDFQGVCDNVSNNKFPLLKQARKYFLSEEITKSSTLSTILEPTVSITSKPTDGEDVPAIKKEDDLRKLY